MPDPVPDPLLDLAGAVLDGSPVDWKAAEHASGPDGQALVRDLRLLAAVAGVHRAVELDPPPSQWGHLRLLESVGRGSSGEVVRAWDTRLDREVALKLLPSEPPDERQRDAVSAFTLLRGDAESILREGRLLARVQHPNVVTIHGAAQVGGRVGLWMEFIHGYTLEQILQKDGVFAPADAIAIGIELCRAMTAVHDAGLVHRDIKAQNVMRDDNGRIVLMDFGTGRELDADATNEVAGTPLYLAPEVFRREPATVRSDIYGLGVILYHLVSGAYPVRGSTVADLRAAHERGERAPLRVAAPAVRAPLARIIERAIDPSPERRFPAAAELGDALAGLQRHERRKPWLYAAAAIGLMAAAGIGAWALRPRTAPAETPIVFNVPPPPAPVFRGGAPQGVRRSVQVNPLEDVSRSARHAWISATLAELLRREVRVTEYFRWMPDDVGLAKTELGEIFWSMPSLRLDDLLDVPASGVRFIPRTMSPDIVVAGHYEASGSPEALRVTLTIRREAGDGAPRTLTEAGGTADMIQLASRLGDGLRDALGAPALTESQSRALAASRPANAAAARAYAEGMAQPARESVVLMQQAMAADPTFAPAQVRLAEGLWLRGEREPARAAAAKASVLSSVLPPEERLLLGVRSAWAGATWAFDGKATQSAVRGVQQLYELFPDTLLYGYALLYGNGLVSRELVPGGREDERILKEILRLPGTAEDAEVLMFEAAAGRRTRDEPRARLALDSATRLAALRNDEPLLGAVRYEQARLALQQAEFVTALTLAEDALQRFRAGKRGAAVLGVRAGIARIVSSQGTFAWVKPQYERLIARPGPGPGDPERVLALKRSLAHALVDYGELSEARAMWVAAEGAGLPNEPADGLIAGLELAEIQYRQGEIAAAAGRARAVLADAESRRDRWREQRARVLLARILLDQGDVRAARDQADRAVALAAGIEDPLRVGLRSASAVAALIRLAEGQPDAARELLASSEVVAMARRYCGADFAMAEALLAVETKMISEAKGPADHAARCAREALQPDAQARADILITQLRLRVHALDGARESFAPVEARLKHTQDRLLKLRAGIATAQLQGELRVSAHVAAATQRLDALSRDATAIGAVAVAFEARLAAGQIEVRASFLESGNARLTALERDATARGLLNLAKKAADARR
jgi:serine/threonine-protein kinase